MSAEPVVWTEGKTDIQHLSRAKEILGRGLGLSFKQLDTDMGDDQLLKQCRAMSMTQQERVTIFIFDRDNPDIIPKVNDEAVGYKDWGNNVYSPCDTGPRTPREPPGSLHRALLSGCRSPEDGRQGTSNLPINRISRQQWTAHDKSTSQRGKQGKTSERKVHCPNSGLRSLQRTTRKRGLIQGRLRT